MNDESVQQTLALLTGFATQLGMDQEKAAQYAQSYLQALMQQTQTGASYMKNGGKTATLEDAVYTLSCLRNGGNCCGKVKKACGGATVGKFEKPAKKLPFWKRLANMSGLNDRSFTANGQTYNAHPTDKYGRDSSYTVTSGGGSTTYEKKITKEEYNSAKKNKK